MGQEEKQEELYLMKSLYPTSKIQLEISILKQNESTTELLESSDEDLKGSLLLQSPEESKVVKNPEVQNEYGTDGNERKSLPKDVEKL